LAFKFEKLIVGQKTRAVSFEIYLLTKKYFPKDELFIRTPQIKRAADSVSLNIAEGSTGQSNPEFIKFFMLCSAFKFRSNGCFVLCQRQKLHGQRKL